MKILSQGQKITTRSGKIPAVITGVCIRGGNTMYEISYFAGADYRQVWIYNFEFDVDESETSKPGFSYPSNQLKIVEGGK